MSAPLRAVLLALGFACVSHGMGADNHAVALASIAVGVYYLIGYAHGQRAA